MIEHNVTLEHKGQGLDRSVKPVCSCGWNGRLENANNQEDEFINVWQQADVHRDDVRQARREIAEAMVLRE